MTDFDLPWWAKSYCVFMIAITVVLILGQHGLGLVTIEGISLTIMVIALILAPFVIMAGMADVFLRRMNGGPKCP